jgi:transcriptional regulator with XRE-family HTH domain
MAAFFPESKRRFSATEMPGITLSGDNTNLTPTEYESSEQTIHRVLSSYEIGRKLRQLRLRKKIALVDLGKHTGLSASMLSQLETGKMVPTLPTLARIAMVFDVGLEHFFDDRKRRKSFNVIRSGDRIRFPERPDIPMPSYFFECLAYSAHGKGLQAYLAFFPPREMKDAHEHFHEGAEFIFVMEGTLSVLFHEEEQVLEAGDSVYFDSSETHAYRGLGEQGCRALVVTTTPRV